MYKNDFIEIPSSFPHVLLECCSRKAFLGGGVMLCHGDGMVELT